MHILFAAPALSKTMGGGDRYVQSLALALAGAGDQVTAVTSLAAVEAEFWTGRSGAPVVTQLAPNLTVIRVPLRPFPGGRRTLVGWRRLMVLLASLPGMPPQWLANMARRFPGLVGYGLALRNHSAGVDLVHGFNLSWEHALVAAQSIARERQLPFIVTPFAHLDGGRSSRNLTMAHQRSLLIAADQVQALSTAEKEHITALGVPAGRVHVVGSGYDPPAVDSPAAARPEVPAPYALFLGRTSVDKGAHHAAAAIARLQAGGHNLHLVLAGARQPEFDRFLAGLPPTDRAAIHPLGRVSESVKLALLQDASMLLLPSRSDSFGIVILEAWAQHRPVIAAAAGGIPGVINDGETGLLVPYGDVTALAGAMERLLVDAALGRRLGQAGFERLQAAYTWPQVAEAVRAGYDRVIAETASN